MSGHCNWVDVPELRYFWCSLLFGEPRHIKKKEEEEKEKSPYTTPYLPLSLGEGV